ncbi:MAG: hypothetical protein Q9207_001676 [Kuettlingeria erythrocarpa]
MRPILWSQSPQIHYVRQAVRAESTTTDKTPVPDKQAENTAAESKAAESTKPKKETMAELDEELRMKMEGKSGEGGEAGLELEDGRPAAMKRGVRNNMFRLI